ncbi:MAG: glyoxalase superfamily protein [Hyphomicrobiales bacterium]
MRFEMKNLYPLPPLEELKAQAKRLRTTLETEGTVISHSRSLELIAHQFGHKDWNTLHAAIGNRPKSPSLKIGDKVNGHYLGQPFKAEILGIQASTRFDKWRVTFLFDEPIDVVTFDSFSAFRRRVTCNIGKDGRTIEKTSNGQPQLSLWT